MFNGIKALSCFYILLASTFMFTWYAYLADPSQLANYKTSFSFLFIYCAYFTAPVLFMTAGFLQTFGFLQESQENMFSASRLAKFYAWRLVKFVPLLGMVLIFSLFLVPFLGAGPIWSLYQQVMAPCETYWWTVLLQVNNIYPRQSFDEKCMPWAWFIPALTQMSLLLPLFVGVYQVMLPNRTLLRVVYAFTMILFCALSGLMTGAFNKGAMPVSISNVDTASGAVNNLTVLNFDFYNDVFMLSPFHLVSYFAGFGLAIVYRRFLLDTELNKSVANSEATTLTRSSRFFTLITENARVRYTTYLVGGMIMLGALLWVYPFMAKPED